VPIGELLAGHAPIVSVGLGSLHSAIAAFAAQVTKTPPALGLTVDGGGPAGLPPPANACSIDGTSMKTCTELGTGEDKFIEFALVADDCAVAGPDGGTAQFNGTIMLESATSSVSACSPLAFTSAELQVGHLDGVTTIPLDVVYANAEADPTRRFQVVLLGTLSLAGPPPPACLINTLQLTLLGGIRTRLGDTSGPLTVETIFFETSVIADRFVFNSDCVPLSYRLKVNGEVSFTLIAPPPAIASEGEDIISSFQVEFSDFFFTQAADGGLLTTEFNGAMSSDCFGAEVEAMTADFILAGADQICPTSGQFSLTSAFGPATIVYDDGAVTVDENGNEKMFPSCLAEDLVTCIPQ
jgi:hypothetical protein